MKRTYQRSSVLSFDELTENQASAAVDELGAKFAHDSNYVLWNNEPLSLSMFMRTDSGLFHGVYGLTAFSAYFIKLNRSNDAATVVYDHW